MHKRLILIATVALLAAAFIRFNVSFLQRNVFHAMLVSYLFLVLLAIYDLWSTHKIHRATLLGSAFLIFVQFVRTPFAHTALWQNFAAWAQSFRL